ncbi:hypothetical protein FACS1894218_1600 [Bacilli bacterium]|nr:hypothetical protein FACS1894218_1600 [Bacilli bacterium]
MLLILRRLKQHGHNAYAILGGATGQIGDPSGKNLERVMKSMDEIDNNSKAIEAQIIKYAQTEVINNNTIYQKMSMFDFLRNIGKLVNVNYLLEKDLIKSRLDVGISFTEFSYALIQGYDFA